MHPKEIVLAILAKLHQNAQNTFLEQTPENIELIKQFILIAFNAVNGGQKAGTSNIKFAYCAMGIMGGGVPQFCTSSVSRLHQFYAKQQIECKGTIISLKRFKQELRALTENLADGNFIYIHHAKDSNSLSKEAIQNDSDFDYHFLIFKLA